jgi:hypothetical protein
MRPAPSFIRRALSVGSSPAFTRRSAPFVARGVGSADSAAVGDDAEPQHAHGPPPRPRAAAHTTRCRPRSGVVAVAGAGGRLAGIIAGDVSGAAWEHKSILSRLTTRPDFPLSIKCEGQSRLRKRCQDEHEHRSAWG